MALTPGLQLPFGIQPVNPVPVDAWSGPYSGVDESSAVSLANSSIPSGVRFQSLEVRLIVGGISRKYWYRDGITDSDLVEFSGGGVGSQGAQGSQGSSGSQGPQGAAGPQGNIGFQGDIGPQGLVGSQGSDGSQGAIGPQGFQGSTGGVSTIIAGNGLNVVTGSNGEVTISLISSGSGGGDCSPESLFERRQQVVASSTNAGDDVDLGFVIDPIKMSQGRVNVYLNGVLQRLGNKYDVYAGSTATALKFNRDLFTGDLITVHIDPGTSADLVLFQRDYYIVDDEYGPDANIELGFIIDANNFSNGRLNIYLNGVLQRSGVDNDVYLGMTATSLRFNTSLEVGDVITVYSDNCITLMPYPYSSIERNYAAIVSFYDPGDEVDLGFTIDPHKFEKDLISVYLNGILLRPGQDHDFYLGSTLKSLRFNRSIDVGDVIFVQVDHSDGLSSFATLSGDNLFVGNNIFSSGLSGSLQSLANGDPYLISGQGIDIVTGSSGQVIISAGLLTQWNEKPSGNIDGSNDTFVLAYSPVPSEALMLFRDGLLLDSDNGDFILLNNIITLPSPPAAGVRIKASYPYRQS